MKRVIPDPTVMESAWRDYTARLGSRLAHPSEIKVGLWLADYVGLLLEEIERLRLEHAHTIIQRNLARTARNEKAETIEYLQAELRDCQDKAEQWETMWDIVHVEQNTVLAEVIQLRADHAMLIEAVEESTRRLRALRSDRI